MQLIELPDGSEVEFPDDASAIFISNVLQRHSTPGQILHSIMNPKAIEEFRQPVGEIARDIIPGISQQRSVNRIEESLAGIGERSPIGQVLSGADIALEGAGMLADFVPVLKAGAAAAGTLLPMLLRNVDNVGPAIARGQRGGLGVDSLKRAKDLGFRPEIPLFHGGTRGIDEFDLARGGETSGSPVGKLGVSVSLDEGTASEFAGRVKNADGEVIELVHRADKPVTLDLDGTETNFEIASTVEDAWDQGFDSIKFNNYTTPGGQTGKSFILVKEPNQLRSLGAKFDPKKKNSAKLLDSRLLPIPLVGVAAGYIIEGEDETI